MKKNLSITTSEVVIPTNKLSHSIDESCKLIGVTKPTLYKELINTGKLKTFRIKNRRLVSDHALRECIAMLEAEESAA